MMNPGFVNSDDTREKVSFSFVQSHVPWWIKNFDLSHFSMALSKLFIKRISFEKNVQYNLFDLKLSSEKILDQFFVWLPVTNKITGNWENLNLAYF